MLYQFIPASTDYAASNFFRCLTLNIFLVADTPFYVLALITTVFSLLMYFNAFYRHGYLKVNTENVKGANLDLRTKKKDKQKKEK